MVAFADLGYRPRDWQDRAHRAFKRFSVLVVHRRAGKTVLALMTLIDAALRTRKTDARYAYVAPLLKQAKGIAWDYLKRYALRVPGTEVNESELWVQFSNGSRIRLLGADNPDAIRGVYLDGVVLDEVAQMKPEVWGEIIRPALADRKGWALFIGTPHGANLFSELYFAAANNPDWYAGLFTHEDTGALDASEINAMRDEMDDNQFRRELLCDFGAAGEGQLISLVDVEAACRRDLREEQYSHAAKILSVDVARQGEDASTIYRRQGLAVFTPIEVRKLDSQVVGRLVAKEADAWQPDGILIDGTGGFGAGVVDFLRSAGYTVHEVQYAGAADDARFANKRAEIWFAMRDWIKAGGVIPNLPALKRDLCAPRYKHQKDRLILESKEDIKKRGLPSPDHGDGLATGFAVPIRPRQSFGSRGIASGHARVVFDYDPFNRE